MHTKRFCLLFGLAVTLVLGGCAGEEISERPEVETLVQRLNNDSRLGGVKDLTSYPAVLSTDGKNYCAKEEPTLCAPAALSRERSWACRCDSSPPREIGSDWCTCCFWVPGSWPFEISCGRPWDPL